MSTPERLFHLVPTPAWAPGPTWAPPSLAAEGFVHLSFERQLPGTLAVHFAGVPAVLLLELEPASLAPELRLEPSRGGEDFPHLYRALERRDLRGGWRLEAGPAGLAPPPGGLGRPPLDPDTLWPRP